MESKAVTRHAIQSIERNTSPEAYKFLAHDLPSLTLTQRQLCDLELLLNDGFAPLSSYMGKKDYEQVLSRMRLSDGRLWPMPIMLDVDRQFADALQTGNEIALRDAEGLLLAIFQVEESWEVDRDQEAMMVFGTNDKNHPGVAYLFNHLKDIYLGGSLSKISLPHHYDFKHLRYTPAELHDIFKQRGWDKIVAFQTRNPMHRAHQELTIRAAEQTHAIDNVFNFYR